MSAFKMLSASVSVPVLAYFDKRVDRHLIFFPYGKFLNSVDSEQNLRRMISRSSYAAFLYGKHMAMRSSVGLQ